MGFPWGFKSLARHQRNEHGSVVWVRANFLGVWRIEPPRERECEGEDRPRVVGGDMAASCAAVRGGSRVPYVVESASPGNSPALQRSKMWLMHVSLDHR